MADNLIVLLAAAFGFNLPTVDAGLMANGLEPALAGKGLLADGTELPKAYLN